MAYKHIHTDEQKADNLTASFSGFTYVSCCSLDSDSANVPNLCIVHGLAKTIHVLFEIMGSSSQVRILIAHSIRVIPQISNQNHLHSQYVQTISIHSP